MTRITCTLPKLCGADIELGNFVVDARQGELTGAEASRAILREIDGLPNHTAPASLAYSDGTTYDPQDWGRKYLPANGGCIYIDLDHVEACIPEVRSAYDHVAAWHATLRIVRAAQAAANAKRSAARRIQVLVNNSDGRSNSYGSHLSFLITRAAWDNIFSRRLQYQLFLAAFQASSIVVTGQGKVGAENGAPAAAYQIAQRADFFETVCGQQTTYHRPLVNSRDEPLCGPIPRRWTTGAAPARLHCIFFDNTLCHVSSLLKVGLMQIVLAMIEAEQIDTQLLLEDPVAAVHCWSHDPTLRAETPLASGRMVSAVGLQMLFLEAAKQFVAGGGCDGIVPRADDILRLWEATLVKLERGDLGALAGQLDWVLKLHILRRAMTQWPHLGWESPEIKMLDHLYSSLDPTDGLYWAYERSGTVEPVVGDERIAYFESQPPEDTRAWTRAMVLRAVNPDEVDTVDWDSIVLKSGYRGYQRMYRQIDLIDPLAFTKAEQGHVFEGRHDVSAILDGLGATRPAPRRASTSNTDAYGSGYLN